MLTFETPIYRIDDITIFRDHAEPALFYFAAPHPQVTRQNGRLMFDLLTYSVELSHSQLSGTRIPDELGAGFLTLGVDCALSETKRRRLAAGLAGQAGIPEEEIILHPIPYHQGRVRLLALDQFTEPDESSAGGAALPAPLRVRPTFVERVLGAGTPSLLSDLRAIFSLTLTQQGVTFLEGLYRQGAAPVGIVYELDFHGLRPAIDVRIRADLSRIYEHFGGGLSLSYQWIKAEVGAELAKLEETGAIDIEITSQATGEDAQKSKELALSIFKDRIVQEMFRATTPSRQTPQTGGLGDLVGGLTGTGSVALTLKYKRSEELKTVTYDFRERAPEERTHAPQGFLPVLLSPAELERRIHHVNLQNDFFEILEILVTGPPKEDFERFGIRQAQVRLIYPYDDDEANEHTLVFRPESTGDKVVAFRRAGRGTLAYAYQITYEFEHQSETDADALRYELPVRSTTTRSLPLNPHADFGLLDVQIAPGRIHPDVKEVDVVLAYDSPELGFSADERLRFSVGTGERGWTPKRWQVRTRENTGSTYSATYTFYFHDGGSYTAPSFVTRDRLLSVNSPFQHERRLLIRPNAISEQTTAITVELEYRDEAHAYQRGFLLDLKPPFASHEIAWPILDPDKLRVRYRVTVAEPGFLTKGEWQETEDTSLLVGGPVSRRANIQIRLIGAPLSQVGVDAVLVKVESDASAANGPDSQSVLFEPGQTSAEVKLLLPPGANLRYRYQTTAFKSDGQITESSWKESTSSLMVVSTRTL